MPLFVTILCRPGEKAAEEVVGKTKEVQVAGGEVAFAKKMVEESRALLDKVRIYTVLLGHKSSVAEVKKVLHTTPEVTSLTSTQFCQGKTMRWGVAWTFVPGIDLRSVQSVKAKKNKEKPFIWLVPRKEKKERNAGRTYGMIAPWLRELEIETEVGLSSQHLCTVRLTARKKTWIKQRRKRREEARTDKIGGQEDLDPESALIAEQQEAVVVGGGSQTNPCPEEEEGIVLKCELSVRWRGGEDVQVELVPCEGGRDAAHGLLQTLKNRLKAKDKNEHPEG